MDGFFTKLWAMIPKTRGKIKIVELIVDFLQTNQQKLIDEGYDLRSFIERPSSVKSGNK